MLVEVCEQNNVPYLNINLEGHDSAAVASIVSRQILLDLGVKVFELIELHNFPNNSGIDRSA